MKKLIFTFFAIILFFPIYSDDLKIDTSRNNEGIVFQNENVKVVFSETGGKIIKYYLTDYKTVDKKSKYNLIPSSIMNFPIEIEGLKLDGDINKMPYHYNIREDSVVFSVQIGNIIVKKIYKFSRDNYFLDFSLQIKNLDEKGFSYDDIEIQWGPSIAPGTSSKSLQKRYSGAIVFNGKKAKNRYLGKKLLKKIENNNYEWLGYNSLFFAAIMLKENNTIFANIFKDNSSQIWFSTHFGKGILSPNEERNFDVKYYVGPKSIPILKKHGHNLHKLVNLGFFGFLTNFFIFLLKFLYGIVHNYGIAIIVITLLIKLILFPISNTSIKSMKKIAELQPEIKKLQARYKDDPKKLNEETMKLYKVFHVNPVSGCLPMLVQLPFFWAIYSAFSVSIELRGASFFWWINDLSAPDTVMRLIGIPINILPIIMGVAMFIQQEVQGTQKAQGEQMKYMKFLPLIFLIFFWNMPSGLVLYWLLNNVLTIFQTVFINKKNEQ